MSGPRYRAWRFIFPGFETHNEFSGISPSIKGGIELVEEAGSIRQAILLILAIKPGERVMRPDYGCDLFRLTFSPNDDTTAGLAIHYVKQALDRWEPRIEVVQLDANRNQEHSNELDILLNYRIRTSGQREQVNFTFDLTAG